MIANTLLFGLVVLAIDVPWITYVMAPAYRSFYKKAGLSLNTKVFPALIAYTIMMLSYYLLIGKGSTKETLRKAASVGFVAYGIYAFTLLAILEHYPTWLAVMETLWGTFLFSVGAIITNHLTQNWK